MTLLLLTVKLVAGWIQLIRKPFCDYIHSEFTYTYFTVFFKLFASSTIPIQIKMRQFQDRCCSALLDWLENSMT